MDDIIAMLCFLLLLASMGPVAWTVRTTFLWLVTGHCNAPSNGGDIEHNEYVRRQGEH